MGTLLDIALRCEKSEKSEISPPSAPVGDLFSLNSLNSQCNAEKLPANDPGLVAPRWRIAYLDGRVFQVSFWPAATRQETLSLEPDGATAEPISLPMGGSLPHEDEEIIEAVCLRWNASGDEIRDAIQEAAANPRLMDGWRREARALGLDIHTHPETQPHPVAQGFEANIGMDMDDRITCQQCRLLHPGGLCGSPAWGPRYHPPSLPHRCGEFLPRAGDPDQRTGREQRWPGLMEERP